MIQRIVDASPWILLSKAGLLDLLRIEAQDVFVPEAVVRELRAHGLDDHAWRSVEHAPWITRVPTPLIPARVRGWGLGAGESAVLALALEITNCEVVLDDLQARRRATEAAIPVRGSVGIVLLAKNRGAITEARPALARLRQVDLFLSDVLTDETLKLVGE